MSVDRVALAIPEGFLHWNGDPAEDHIGPFFFRPVAVGQVQTALRAQKHHCNMYGGVHGGVLMTFADYTLCLPAMQTPADVIVTVSANCDFVAGAREGDLVTGEGELTRAGGSLLFTRAVLRAGDKVVMTASAVLKRVQKT